MSHDYIQLIEDARVYEVAEKTPLEHAPKLSTKLRNRIYLKREDLQSIFSFKLRGAYNKIASLSGDETKNGVICSSAGNHGQGVALASKKRGCRATIVMPQTTPAIKVRAAEQLGGDVILHGDTYDDAQDRARELATSNNLTFIHPFDDPLVIAGQGTIGKEILDQIDGGIDYIAVPIGGGGLMAGIASYVKAMRPEVTMLGIEPEDSAAMAASLRAGRPVVLDKVGIFADGVAVKRVGDETFRLCQMHVDEIVTVDTDQICAAIQAIFEDTRSIVEPAGALAVAGINKFISANQTKDKTFVALNGGANVNFDRLRHIAERAAIGEQREALFAVEIAEKPGSFDTFCRTIGRRAVTEFNYRYNDSKRAHIFVGVELTGGKSERLSILADLGAEGYDVEDMTDNEVAKLHIRHLVGGSGRELANERLFRFRFPERPGALQNFLEAIGDRWNISLFHYRNHGSDYGRILTGIQVPPEDADKFASHLEELGYVYWDETDNPACRLFLA